jgi:hypothetical protein
MSIFVLIFWLHFTGPHQGTVQTIEVAAIAKTPQECRDADPDTTAKHLDDYAQHKAAGDTPEIVCGIAPPDHAQASPPSDAPKSPDDNHGAPKSSDPDQDEHPYLEHPSNEFQDPHIGDATT